VRFGRIIEGYPAGETGTRGAWAAVCQAGQVLICFAPALAAAEAASWVADGQVQAVDGLALAILRGGAVRPIGFIALF
jgi:hypothetical protein